MITLDVLHAGPVANVHRDHVRRSPMLVPTPEPIAEVDRLGDQIAELAAHLDAATARLLELIREFDERGGWNNGFRSCAEWLTWRIGLDPGAPAERYQVVVHVDAPVLANADASGQSVVDDGTHVAAETLQRLACDATRVMMHHDADGRITEVGARTRTIPRTAGRRRCPISRCCAGDITGPCTKKAFR